MSDRDSEGGFLMISSRYWGLDTAEKLLSHKYRGVVVYGDPDVDGLFAMRLAHNFAVLCNLKHICYVNGRREHGFKLDAHKLKGCLVLAVDFLISESEMEGIVSQGVTVICIDHHDVKQHILKGSTEGVSCGVLISNQYPEEDERKRYLSGAGMAYECFSIMLKDLGVKGCFDDDDKATVGVTLLSDQRVIETPDAAEYLRHTYTHISPYFSYLLGYLQGPYSKPTRLDRNAIDFSLSPLINSLLRFGYVNEAIRFVFGQGLSVIDTRAKQKDLVALMCERMRVYSYRHFDLVLLDADRFREDVTMFIGLLASRVKGDNGKSTMALAMRGGKLLRGSFRGRFDGVRYLDLFQKYGHCEGHQISFGVKSWGCGDHAKLDSLIGELESRAKPQARVTDVTSLSEAVKSIGRKVAEYNDYVRSANRWSFRCKGLKASLIASSGRMRLYRVDDLDVRTFGEDLEGCFIIPLMQDGYLTLQGKHTLTG